VLRQNPPWKDLLQKMPLGKLSFFAYVISQKRSANQQKQLCNDAFHVKTSQSAKNQLDPAKNKNRPKMLYTPFLHESLQFFCFISKRSDFGRISKY